MASNCKVLIWSVTQQTFVATCAHFFSSCTVSGCRPYAVALIHLFCGAAAGHQVHRQENDAAPLHSSHCEGEISGAGQLSQQNSCPYNVRLHTRCSAPHRNSFFSIGCGPSLSFRTHSSESFQSWQYFALRRESGYGSYADIIILYRQKYWDTCPLHPEEAKKQYHDTSTLLERLSVREKLFQSFFSLPPGELDGLYGQIFQETSCMKCSVPLHNQWSSLFWTAQPIKTTYTVWHQYWFRDEINWALKICLVTGMIGFVVLFFFFFVESISIWFNSFCV